MKKTIYILISICISLSIANAQETSAKLKEAETAYSNHNLDNARMALQDALEGINKEIGNEILKMLPVKLNELSCNQKEDNVTGASGFAGLFVTRSYASGEKNGKIEIMGDSPMIVSLNAILSMPTFMSGSNSNDKKVKVAGYKGLLSKSAGDNNNTSYTLQIPMNQTLVTFTVKGIFTENDILNMANTIPFDKIAKYAQ